MGNAMGKFPDSAGARTPQVCAGLGALAQLFCEPGADSLLLQGGEIFDKYLALEVIHFMLYAHGEQALCL